jgi:predicted HNH restriction endonuclease
MKNNTNRNIKELIKGIGSETFVDYFEFFAENVNAKNNDVFKNEFLKRGENWNEGMLRTNASNWKPIFKQKREIEALHYTANNKNLSDKKRKKASILLDKLDHIFPDEILNKDAENLKEGAKRTIIVNAYERNLDARKQCIEYYGYTCCVCFRSFEEMYGNIGKEYIHVHHIKPLSEIEEECQINPINDLRPVCPNCHAIIHKANVNIDELKLIFKENNCQKN